METTEVKNAFEGLMEEFRLCTEKAANLQGVVLEAHKLLNGEVPGPIAEAVTKATELLGSALEKH